MPAESVLGSDKGGDRRHLDDDDKHQDELARFEASVHLARQLASDAEIQSAFTEAAGLARARERRRTNAWGPRWFRNPAIAWAVAGASAAVALLAIVTEIVELLGK